MDLRTKFVFALVAVSLGSMVIFGVTTYGSARRQLSERLLNQLDGVAASKEEALLEIVAGWHERVGLVASRTQLRVSLAAFNDGGGPVEVARIERILSDALRAARFVESLRVDDPQGREVASVGSTVELEAHSDDRILGPGRVSGYESVVVSADGDALVDFSAPLVLDGTVEGALHARLRAEELAAVAGNYRGLGDTGETLIVAEDARGVARVLHPVRHPGADLSGGLPRDPSLPSRRALGGEEVLFANGTVDYRGERVWAATRYLPETGWGLVVKVDAVEEAMPIMQLRDEMIRWAFIIAAFAVAGGMLLGFRFAGPILHLSDVADRIREGEMDARAQVHREDEVGQLTRTFNQMASELQVQMEGLREFKKFFDVSLDLLCIAGTDGYFKRTNPAFQRALGWSAEELSSRPFIEFVHPDDAAATLEEIDRLADGIPTISFHNRYRATDGSYRHLSWTAFPEPASKLVYAVAMVIDDPMGGDAP